MINWDFISLFLWISIMSVSRDITLLSQIWEGPQGLCSSLGFCRLLKLCSLSEVQSSRVCENWSNTIWSYKGTGGRRSYNALKTHLLLILYSNTLIFLLWMRKLKWHKYQNGKQNPWLSPLQQNWDQAQFNSWSHSSDTHSHPKRLSRFGCNWEGWSPESGSVEVACRVKFYVKNALSVAESWACHLTSHGKWSIWLAKTSRRGCWEEQISHVVSWGLVHILSD